MSNRNITIYLTLIVALCISGCAASQTASPKSEDQGLDNMAPISKEKFEKWAPDSLGDLSLTSKEHGNPPDGQENKNNIHLIYTSKSQDKSIDLYVVDSTENPKDMEMIDFSYAMENDGKDEEDINPYIAQYNEEEKVTMLLYKVGDSLFVSATGSNLDAEKMWAYVQKLEVNNLLLD